METLILVLLLLGAVLVSSVLDQIIPKVSLPLVQIAIGLIVAMCIPGQVGITLDPELFLVLFIAPLLYDEAKTADRATLWKLRNPVISLAVGLVVATALCIGFSVHALIPSIPLAAAFALGAALGPTDAVAVSSLSRVVSIPERQKGILKGELLLNDASGIVSFQFAIAAVVTGSFSLLHATFDFLFEFCGGLLVGFLLGLIAKFLLKRAQDLGVDNTTFHVIFEVFSPFLIYLIADSFGVSGVISVVVAGLMDITSTRDAGPSVSKMNIVSNSVWKVLSFTLNGIVFVLLGTQLPYAMERTWDNVTINNGMLIAYVLVITAILIGVRFLWIAVMEFLQRRTDGRTVKEVLRDTLITTLSGPKGTITLSIMFSIPVFVSTSPAVAFPQRSLLIFLACGVIVCTLLLSTFVVPLIAPKPKPADEEVLERETKLIVDMLSSVMAELGALRTSENRMAVERATYAYKTRISKMVNEHDLEEDDSELRLQALHWQAEKIDLMLENDEIDSDIARRCLNNLSNAESVLTRKKRSGIALHQRIERLKMMLRRLKLIIKHHTPLPVKGDRNTVLRKAQLEASEYALERLTALLSDPSYPSYETSELILQYQRACNSLRQQQPSITAIARAEDDSEAILLVGYQMELERIQSLYEDELISRETANRLRNNVAVMRMDSEGVI